VKKNFLDESLTEEDFTEWARDYVEDVKSGAWKQKGYSLWEYEMSKLFLQAYCSALSRADDIVTRGVQCYTMHPGVIKSDINGQNQNYKALVEGTRSAMKLIEREFKINPQEQGGFYHEDGSLLRLGEPFDFQLK
jgi:NAD(P)-dependent dehydrogenase (short-subunit alcohol dehydrogenase family)